MKFAIYHGDEEWVLKGIGQDLASALNKLKSKKYVANSISVTTTDKVFHGVRLEADYHIFVQQGQLNVSISGNPDSLPHQTICLFTHLDIKNFKPQILNKCSLVIFNSAAQLSLAIANGYNPKNALLQPYGVDPTLHQIYALSNPSLSSVHQALLAKGKILPTNRCAVGFCGRYWDKSTYVRRKNYQLVRDVVYKLIEARIPVIIIGPGWRNFITIKSPYLSIIETEYTNYPYFYNLMKVFVSLSIHEGGPLPLLESMACGCYPIVTSTGNAFDVLSSTDNIGEIISPFLTASQVYDIILKRLSFDIDSLSIRQHASQFSFDALAGRILKFAYPHSQS